MASSFSSPSPSSSPGPTSLSSSTHTRATVLPLPEPTTNHLIALPQLLHPLSPALAALHMARVRLALSIPSGSEYGPRRTSISRKGGKGSSGGWCHLCGGLKQGTGGAERRPAKSQQPGLGSGSSSGSGVKSQKGKKGKAKGRPKTADPQHQRQGQEADSSFSSTQGTGTKRKAPECETCGASFKRCRPDLATLNDYPPARRTRRATRAEGALDLGHGRTNDGDPIGNQDQVRDQGQGQSDGIAATAIVKIVSSEKEGQLGYRARPPSTAAEVDTERPVDLDGAGIDPTKGQAPHRQEEQVDTRPTPLGGSILQAKPQPKPLLSRPSLTHISSSSPNIPTYPKPATTIPLSPQPSSVTPSSQKPGSSAARSGSGSGQSHTAGAGAGAAAGKRKKKSGLAKLLAENKERQQAGAGQGGGLWGLG
ncbi:hypothetical protein IAU59_007292 [Kwoniella sp. CBS 9459]